MIFGIIYNICFILCTLPQIFKLIKTKDTSGVSLWTYILLLCGALSGIIYGYCIKATFVLTIGVYDSLAAIIIIYLILKYRKLDLYPKALI